MNISLFKKDTDSSNSPPKIDVSLPKQDPVLGAVIPLCVLSVIILLLGFGLYTFYHLWQKERNRLNLLQTRIEVLELSEQVRSNDPSRERISRLQDEFSSWRRPTKARLDRLEKRLEDLDSFVTKLEWRMNQMTAPADKDKDAAPPRK